MSEDRGAARPQPDAADTNRTLTVADVLALPVVAAGAPRVVAGHSQLGRAVRWVHITELTDPASFLKGGELVLTTGVPLPDAPSEVRRYVDELATVRAAGLVIELIRRYREPPEALVSACRARDLPLVVLTRDINFVDVTQVVHAMILNNQMAAMRRTGEIHDTFTALTLRGAEPEEIVRTAAELSGRHVVLENLVHQAVVCQPFGGPTADLLTGWERRSRATPSAEHTAVLGREGWLVTPVEYRGERWGRLVLVPPAGGDPEFGPEQVTVLERAAMALTIARLTHPTTWERRAHRSALLDIVEQRYRSAAEARARVEALGLPTAEHRLLALLFTLTPDEPAAPVEERLVGETAKAGAAALVGELTPGSVGVLLALAPSRPWRELVERFSHAVRASHPDVLVSVGAEVADIAEVARSFRQARRVADATIPGAEGKPFHEPADIGLRQLLYSLRGDLRVQDYVERLLGRLVDHDSRHGTDLLPTLRYYLDAAGNKTIAARRGELSRQTLYQRLRSIERLLDCDLESGEQRTQLHVALTALDVLRLPSRKPS